MRLIHDRDDSTDGYRCERTHRSRDRDGPALHRQCVRSDAKSRAAMSSPAMQAIDAALERIRTCRKVDDFPIVAK